MSRTWNAFRSLGIVVPALTAATVFAGPSAAMASRTERIEVHPIATFDRSTDEIYWSEDKSKNSPPLRMIAGELRLPNTPAPKIPAVVFLHGDAGVIGNQPPWIEEFVAMGIAVFTVDSFTGRGLVAKGPQEIGFNAPWPSAATRLADAYAALAILAAHPRIDATRIVLMGTSSGGRTTTLAAMKRFSTTFATSPRRFAAYVALYPPCRLQMTGDENLEAGPLRIYVGEADNVTRADACERYVARLRKSGVDADITIYPGAPHGFDNPADAPVFSDAGQPSYSACTLVERGHTFVTVETGLPAASGDRCVTKGYVAAPDPVADLAVRKDIRAFLLKALQ